MANEKILILEAPWSDDIEDTYSAHDIYASADTLLRLGPVPIRMIHRPLVSSTYLSDITRFVNLECNRRGPNVVILSAHGSRKITSKRKIRHKLEAIDGEIDISKEIRKLKQSLGRTIIILDSCDIGKDVRVFREASSALAVIGFENDVSWIDSAVFVLALMLNFHEEGVFHLERARSSSKETQSLPEKVTKSMLEGTYRSLGESLGVECSFGSKSE